MSYKTPCNIRHAILFNYNVILICVGCSICMSYIINGIKGAGVKPPPGFFNP